MANWEKLNQEFYEALESMTHADWEALYGEAGKTERKAKKEAERERRRQESFLYFAQQDYPGKGSSVESCGDSNLPNRFHTEDEQIVITQAGVSSVPLVVQFSERGNIPFPLAS